MIYLFGDCTLDTDRRELRRASAIIEIEPQVFDLLEFLIRQRDRVVSRDDVLAAVWNGRIVSESTLSSRINAARVAIGDDGASQRLIRTLPRKGLRFVGEVREEQGAPRVETAPPAAPETLTPARRADPAITDGPSIAVLPFTNMSGDPESDYFADGMAEEIITALSRCSGIFVIARNSSFTYKGRAVDVRQVGRELGVGYVLEGSVRRSEDRLRITAQLIEATAGTHLWADRFDGNLSDVFELQDRIAETAAAVIEPRLRLAEEEWVRRKPPKSLDAYDLWMRALSHAGQFTRESMAAALRCLDQALEIDPSYAPAMASFAYYHSHCHFQGWMTQPDDKRDRAIKLATDAVDLARTDANVLWQAAFAVWTLQRDGSRALELFRRSLQINPNSAIALGMAGWVEAANGNPAEGRRLLEKSQRLSPRHPRGWFVSTGMAIACLADSKFQEAVTWCEKALAENPRFGVALRVLAVALVNDGQLERAKKKVAEALELEPHLTLSGLRTRIPLRQAAPILDLYRESLKKAGLPE
jgi:TolB-like protein/Flp pilus assembly protein TadD